MRQVIFMATYLAFDEFDLNGLSVKKTRSSGSITVVSMSRSRDHSRQVTNDFLFVATGLSYAGGNLIVALDSKSRPVGFIKGI